MHTHPNAHEEAGGREKNLGELQGFAPRVWVGCCGWSYREWVGPFYRSRRGMFAQYSEVFGVAEVDSTFYRVPRREAFRALARLSPPDFRFSAKLPRAVTHEARCELTPSVKDELEQLLESLEPLGSKLFCLLVQLPPSFTYEEGVSRLSRLLEHLSTEAKGVRLAVEFRHPSWVEPQNLGGAKELLSTHGASWVVVDEPLLPPIHVGGSPLVYVRLHGRGNPTWYDYLYSDTELAEWAGRVKGFVEDQETGEVIVVFNNHPHGYAPRNALRFMEMLGLPLRTPPTVPRRAGQPILDDYMNS
ncbi:hypothetical protein B9Q04_12805 [Candidatus Marsarchaeota G2 archaeon BE_D]|uniref:DUF72 domain-containing protein n=1 Tax=Candidatus Marsarchaeota G2 archaeon BE_D TaxID=1978158 RepID=A0A2R6C8A0_9ARCH|nr:MAG: hypothetical protein B9Q04_12805 [Candidatus Marsarchaeota G2 archaeon BE_D]